MDLTSTFNAVAGPGGEMGTVGSGPTPNMPSPPAATAAFDSAQNSQFIPAAHEPQTVHIAGAIESHRDEHAEQGMTVRRAPAPVASGAAAELEMLEDGRATPAARHNLNPRPKLKKIVDAQVEGQREARIGALKAYLRLQRTEAIRDARHENAEELEFGL